MVGFVTAISNGVLSAFIPLLERFELMLLDGMGLRRRRLLAE